MLRFDRLAALAATLVIAVAGCSPTGPEVQAPPPPPPPEAPPPSLAGGPPPSDEAASASQPPVVVTMAPIPNPEDLAPEQRRRLYGPVWREHRPVVAPGRVHRVGRRPHYASGPHAFAHHGIAGHLSAARRMMAHHPSSRHLVAHRRLRHQIPVARRAGVPTFHTAKAVPPPRAPVPGRPQAHAPPPLPAPEPVVPVAPVVPAARVPVTPVKPPAIATKPADKGARFQTAVGQAVTQGSTLTVGPQIAAGKTDSVSLSLPANLWDVLHKNAAKFGLRRAARQADVSAVLLGSGYSIAPNGQQTATLKPGQAARFSWQVTPGQGASGPLKAQIEAVLKGQGGPKRFSLATIQSALAAAPPQGEPAANGFKWPDLSFLFGKPSASAGSDVQSPLKDRTVPFLGRVSARAQIAAALGVLAVLILLLIRRNQAHKRKAAERRRKGDMAGGQRPADADPEPTTTKR